MKLQDNHSVKNHELLLSQYSFVFPVILERISRLVFNQSSGSPSLIQPNYLTSQLNQNKEFEIHVHQGCNPCAINPSIFIQSHKI